MSNIKVEYFIESDGMTDEEYGNQEFRKFTITEDMLYQLVRENVELKKGEEVCSENFFINLER